MKAWVVGCLVTVLGVVGLAQEGLSDWGDKALSFVQSLAELIGKGLVRLINFILPEGRQVSADLVMPLGYLGLLTLVLILFGLLEAARKVIWIGVIVGWALLVVRIILDVLGR